MTEKEALKLALDAFGEIAWSNETQWQRDRAKEAITAIKEALAQPEQEPVAWRAWVSKFPQGTGSDWVYVTNPIMKDKIHNQPLYTTPPQRTWVGLTNDEIDQGLLRSDYAFKTAEAWRAGVVFAMTKLKQKNGYDS